MNRLVTLVLTLTACLVVVLPELAQAQSDREQVRVELERTDRAIERGQSHLADTRCARGDQLLNSARDLQRQARGQFLANTRTGTAQALGMTRMAQRRVAEAIESCQVDFQAHQLVESLFEEIEQAAREVRSCAEGAVPPEIERLLEAGLEQLGKARDAYRSEQYREAVQRATTARNLIGRALQRCRKETLAEGGAERVGSALDRTDEFLSDLGSHPALIGNPRARAALERATSQQSQARSFFLRHEFGLALKATELARSRARETESLLEQTPDRDRVARAVEQVAEMITDLAGDIRASEREDAISLLEKAGDALELARAELADDKLTAAGRAARIAGTLLERAAQKAGLR